MKFDGYAASWIGDDPCEVLDVVAGRLGGRLELPGHRVGRFSGVGQVLLGDRVAAWSGVDCANPGRCFFEAKGWSTPFAVEEFRGVLPAHNVARCDVAADFEDDYASLCAEVRRCVRGLRRPPALMELVPDDPDAGRTLCSVRRGSRGYLRLYEAGKVPGHCLEGTGVVRLEAELRPDSSLKAWMASADEAAAVSSVPWLGAVFSGVAGMQVEAVPARPVASDDVETWVPGFHRLYGRRVRALARRFDGDLDKAFAELARQFARFDALSRGRVAS